MALARPRRVHTAPRGCLPLLVWTVRRAIDGADGAAKRCVAWGRRQALVIAPRLGQMDLDGAACSLQSLLGGRRSAAQVPDCQVADSQEFICRA
ncbi:hypothetical protein SETIT_2G274500v2 [Setaria italica]|uniref:Uncharacterized protein n=1 Tax=Setaria italica TaxID=4555 RepID=A0A368Q3L5_SETIT|nr:hypothetical protein SETIT_2G274500v2 [Setaria italica]